MAPYNKRVKPHSHEFAQRMDKHRKGMTPDQFEEYRKELAEEINPDFPGRAKKFIEGKDTIPETLLEHYMRITFGAVNSGPGKEMYDLGRQYIEVLAEEKKQRKSAIDPSAVKNPDQEREL